MKNIKKFNHILNKQYLVSIFAKNYHTKCVGQGFEKQIYLLNENNQQISFWNDIPLKLDNNPDHILKCGIEISSNQLAKMEVKKNKNNYHPIMQDTRKNKYDKNLSDELRYYAQFPIFFNYGFLPQTWENPLYLQYDIENKIADDDPLDVIELSDIPINSGTILDVKCLGSFCLIDQGEVDWKILCININFAKQHKIQSLSDYEKMHPGRLKLIQNWFEFIKTYDGKKKNSIFKNGEIFSVDYTMKKVQQYYDDWQILRQINTKALEEIKNHYQKYSITNFTKFCEDLKEKHKKYFMI